MALNYIFIDHTSKLGGGELALSRYLTWENRNYHVDLILFEDGELAEIASGADYVDVHIISEPNKIKRLIKLYSILKSLEGLIVANSLSALIHISLLPGTLSRTVYYLRHEAYRDDISSLKNLLLKYIAFRRCKGFLANSEYTRQTLESSCLIERCKLVYTVSGAIVKRDSGELRQISNPLRILSLSRLTEWKGVHLIVEAVESLNQGKPTPSVYLTIAGGALFGEEDYLEILSDRANKSQGTIRLVGHVGDIDPLLRSHDVLVSASIKPEPFGQILIQGMSAGLITIGTAQGGAQEIIQDGISGYLAQPDSVVSLAALLSRIMNQPQNKTYEMRKAGLRRAHEFADSRMLELLEDALAYF